MDLPSIEMDMSVEGVSLEGQLDWTRMSCFGPVILWPLDIQVEMSDRELNLETRNLGENLELKI